MNFLLQKKAPLGLLFLCWMLFFISSHCLADNSRKIALVMKALSNPFFYKMELGAKRYAEENYISLEVFGIQNEVDVDHQINIIESLIARNYGAIVLAPADSDKLVDVCKKAIDNGITVINIDNPLNKAILADHNITIPFIGSDNRAGGRLIGNYLKRKLSGKGNVIVIEGIRGVKNAELRKSGFIEAVTTNSSVRIIASETGNWNTEEAFSVTMKLLQNHPDVDAVFCANDKMAIGALQALDMVNTGRKILLTGYDNIDSVRNEMENGRINATIEQHPEQMGAYGVMLAEKRLRGEVIPDKMPTPIDIITHEHFNKKIAFSISNTKNPFFFSMIRGAKEAADLYGMDLIIKDADNENSQQLMDITEFMRQKADLIVINPTNAESVIPAIEMAQMKKIPVITVDRKSAGGKILSHVACDNREGGRIAARLIARHLKGKGRILEIEGIPGTSATHERGYGFNDELKKFSGLKVVSREVANFNRNESKSVVVKQIREGLQFDAVFAHNDNMIIGAMDALNSKNTTHGKILIGFDGIKDAVFAVKAGKITATIAQQPEMMGKMAIDATADFFRGKTISSVIPVKLSVISKKREVQLVP